MWLLLCPELYPDVLLKIACKNDWYLILLKIMLLRHLHMVQHNTAATTKISIFSLSKLYNQPAGIRWPSWVALFRKREFYFNKLLLIICCTTRTINRACMFRTDHLFHSLYLFFEVQQKREDLYMLRNRALKRKLHSSRGVPITIARYQACHTISVCQYYILYIFRKYNRTPPFKIAENDCGNIFLHMALTS
jgi:hypothetical protein